MSSQAHLGITYSFNILCAAKINKIKKLVVNHISTSYDEVIRLRCFHEPFIKVFSYFVRLKFFSSH